MISLLENSEKLFFLVLYISNKWTIHVYGPSCPEASHRQWRLEISKRIPFDGWCAFPIRQGRGERLKNSVVSEVIETLNRNGLGDEKKVKSANRVGILPAWFLYYSNSICLCLWQKHVDRHFLELHSKEIKEHVKRSNLLPLSDSRKRNSHHC